MGSWGSTACTLPLGPIRRGAEAQETVTCPEPAVCSGVQPAIQIEAWGDQGQGQGSLSQAELAFGAQFYGCLGKKNNRVPSEESYGK